MIEPTSNDIGRRVIYVAPPSFKAKEGVIASFNNHYVFVRYGTASCSEATRRSNLKWMSRDA